MAGRIFLANVGANASHRFAGPVFPNGTFEFLPIPEDRDLADPNAVRYRDLRSHYDPARDLRQYVPQRLWDWPAHYDPEFDTLTYGDNCGKSPRAASLKRLDPGDFLFFIVRLARAQPSPEAGTHGFFLIGFLEVEETLPDVRRRPETDTLRRFEANAHVRRGLSDPGLWDGFWMFRGSSRSQRFHKAVPVTRELATRLFTSADGSAWRWDDGRTDLQVIGSYTRSCRCVIDPSLSGYGARVEALWATVARQAS